jgi:predicted nucleic acid-binding protein
MMDVRTFAASLVGNLVGRGTGGELRGVLRTEADDLFKAAMNFLGPSRRRERIASEIMAGLVAGRHINPDELAASAVKCADALIAALGK